MEGCNEIFLIFGIKLVLYPPGIHIPSDGTLRSVNFKFWLGFIRIGHEVA